MRNRIKDINSVVAYANKTQLRSIKIPKYEHNPLEHSSLAVRKSISIPADIPAEERGIYLIARALSLDIYSYKLFKYIFKQKLTHQASLVKLHYLKYQKDTQDESISLEAFYTSIKALCYIFAIAPSHEVSVYHTNPQYFKQFDPTVTFPVTLRFIGVNETSGQEINQDS